MKDEGFGLYVHWPFCLSKCPYCDFNSHVADRVDQARWRRALLTELAHYAADTSGRTLTSVFFGGGTPSLMEPETTAAILEAAGRHWRLAPDLEVTLEANPGAVDRAKFEGFAQAGVNRVSLGVQALDDAALAFLGRRHDRGEALAALEAAQSLFARTSIDLIYARPGQAPEEWRQELRRALEILAGHGHLSLYQLTVEQGTKFYLDWHRGDWRLPEEDDAVALWQVTREETARAGLPAYEVSNHARPGEECRHNLVYWRGGDYVGVGPGAHGRLTLAGVPHATRQHRAPEIWLKRVEEAGHAATDREPLDPDQRAEELLLMGLRLTEGIDKARFARLAGRPLADCIDAAALAGLAEEGLVTDTPSHLRATEAGMLVLNGVIAALVPA
ncbi:radical SAM family heme chaperone HemW [Caenispirillum bisanense]|uniref:Heme chaperone HemW n=1 Tax=Caenispirillum bisanense TaxID=414052 RepID=A0A286G969_9PROT|nr:radical SAM family heme chaperone HemW [Caenispirillum bisanense]SOD92071.1 oxygen-independent coproporphyrinogen-3 oxidase [Caenispirillum bisanense]